MADKPLPWFRAYHEAAFDPKFDVIAANINIHPLIVFGAWWKLLCLAGASPIRGSLYVTVKKRYSNDDVTTMLRCSNDDCNALLQAFIDMDMLEIDDVGAYHIKNWDKRQFDSDSSTKRVQEHRNKNNRGQKRYSNSDVTFQDCYSNGDVTPPDSDTDTDLSIAPIGASESDPPPKQKVLMMERQPFMVGWSDEQLIITPPQEMTSAEKTAQYQERTKQALVKGLNNKARGEPDLSWLDEDLWGLARVYITEANHIPLRTEHNYWRKVLWEQHDYGLAPPDIRRAIEKMRNDGLTIKSPRSVTDIARDLMRRKGYKEEKFNEEYS